MFILPQTLKTLAKSFLVLAMIGGVTVGTLMVTEVHAAKMGGKKT
jgi:hypothetical protein